MLLLILLIQNACTAQNTLQQYLGPWSGQVQSEDPFAFHIEIDPSRSKGLIARFSGVDHTTEIALVNEDDTYLVGSFEDQLAIRIDTTTEAYWTAFIQTGHHLSHVKCTKSATGVYEADWNLWIGEGVRPTIYLSLEQSEDGNNNASLFFKEPTFHYSWARGFEWEEGEISFFDYFSNLKYKGDLKEKTIDLHAFFLNAKSTIRLEPLPFDQWEIGQARENTNTESSVFANLVRDVKNNTLDNTHAIVVSQHNQIVFEEYFDGFTANTVHDVRSLAKTFAGTMTGIAIDDDQLSSANLAIGPFFTKRYPDIDWSNKKEEITIHDLLTMSSGLDAIDFGLNRNSFANEGTYQSQEDWTKHILSAPMVHPPGEVSNYGSGNSHLIGPILSTQIEDRMEFYMHRTLFEPLSITNYRIQTDNKGAPYFGGGWYFTPRDLVTFGELYLLQGTWNGQELIAQNWIEKSMKNYFELQNTTDKNGYGYFLWHKTYQVDGVEVHAVEARGSGGQYLFLVPDHHLVVAITSGNYRNGKFNQPERIMEEYILPEMIK